MKESGYIVKRLNWIIAFNVLIGMFLAFGQIQAATTIGANISTDGYLKIGTAVPGSPANGMIYYDSGTNKFKCYQNSSWVDCIGTISGTLPVNQGGTGLSSYTAGDLLYATGATTLSKLAIGANGQILTSNGTAPVWTNTNPLVLTNTYVHDTLNGANPCTSESQALVGDVCIATVDNKTYILQTSPYSAAGNWTELIASSGLYLQKSNNLSDLTNFATARTNLGLGTGNSPTFNGLTLTTALDFNTATNPVYSEGLVFYDSTDKSLAYYNDSSSVTVNLGQESLTRVYNNTGSQINNGQVVYINGSNGDVPTVALAKADSLTTSRVSGIATMDIPDASYGYITYFGLVHGLNTATFSAGDMIYLSASTAGAMTATRPAQPNQTVGLGFIVKSDASTGILLTEVGPSRYGAFSSGAVAFGDTNGQIRGDDSHLYFDSTLDRLGIGTNTPAYTLDVRGSIKAGDGSLVVLGSKTDPAPAGVNGAMYYNTTSNTFKCYQNSAWKDCDTIGTVAADSLDFTEFKDAMAVDANTTIDLGANNLGITGTGAGVLTLTSGQAATWGTTAGNLNLAVNGSSTGNVQIGTGGAGTTTPDFLALDVKSTTGDPAGGAEGYMYYNTFDNKFRCYQNTGWTDCLNVGGGSSVLSDLTAATGSNSINNGDNDQTWNWSLTTAGKTGLALAENVASTGVGSAIIEASTLATSTATPLRVINRGTAPSFIVENTPADTTPPLYIMPADLTSAGHVAIGSSSFDPTNPEKLKVDSGTEASFNIISAAGNLDNYLQINIQNRNSGASASSDMVATADNGDENINYVDMGINSSGYNVGAYDIGGPNDAYILAQGDPLSAFGGNLSIGTGTANTAIKFHTGGSQAVNEKMRIEDTGFVGIATTSPGSELDVKGTLRLSGATSGFVGLAPAAAAGSTTYTLPAADGLSGEALVTNGSGLLSWSSATSKWQRVGTVLSPLTAGDDVTTSGNISTSSGGTITSAGLLTGSLGLTVSGATVSLNDNSNFNTTINTGSSTGTVTIGSSNAGAIQLISGAGLTLTGGAASNINTTSGNLNFQPAGALTTANVQIGAGTGSATPDLLVVDIKNTAGDPSGTNGAIYYNSNTNKFRCYRGGSWVDCSASSLDSITAATGANSINNGGNAQTWNWNLVTPADNGKSGLTISENTASSGTGTSLLNVATLASSTATPLIVTNLGASESFRVNDESADVTPFIVNKDGKVLIGIDTLSAFQEQLRVDSGNFASPNVIGAGGDLDQQLNIGIQNRNNGANAMSIFGALADNGNLTSNFVAMGIASSGFSNGSYQIAGPNDAFMATTGGDMIIGAAIPNNDVKFIAGDYFNNTAQRMTISGQAATLGNVGIGVISPNINARLDIGPSTADALRIEPFATGAGNTGALEFMELAANGSNYVGFKAPDSISANKIWTLPSADGSSGEFLSTDGSGALSWASSGGYLQRIGTVLSPATPGDDFTTTGAISTTSTGTITSAGLLTGQSGLTASGAAISLNDNSNFNTSLNTGTSTGTVTIGSTNAGAIGVTTGAALTLTGGAASSFSTTAGNLSFQPAGTGTTGHVQVGVGGAGSTTPDLLVLDLKTDAGDPENLTAPDGAMYYNENIEKFRCRINGSWSDCDTTGGTTTLQSAYNSGATITTSASTDIALTLTSGNFTASGVGAVNLTPTSASSFTSGGALTLTGGAASTWSTSAGALTLTSATAATWGTTAGVLTLQAAGTGTTSSINIGAGGAGSTTPDLLGLDVKSDTGDPAGYNGAMYYNEFSDVFRCYEAGGWKDCDTGVAAGSLTLQQAYNAGGTITTSGTNPIAFTLASGNFTASGVGAVNLTPTSASSFTSGGALTLTGGAASTWGTSSGNLTLQVAGTGTTANVQIGVGGAGSTTPDLFALDVKSDAGDPAGFNGAMYYNDNLNEFRCYENGAWIDCDGASYINLQNAYNGGATITTAGSNIAFTLNTTDQFTATGAGSVNLTPTGASSFTSGGALTLTGGAASTWGTSAGALSLQAAGTGTTSTVQIGVGGAGSTTPDYLALDVKSTTGDPAGGVEGDMYYNTFDNKFRCFENSAWKDCDNGIPKSFIATKGDLVTFNGVTGQIQTLPVTPTSGWVLTADSSQATGMKWAADVPSANSLDFAQFSDTMTVDANTSINLAGKNLTINGLTSGGILDMSTNGAALTLTAGAASTWSTSAGALTIDSAAALNIGNTNATSLSLGRAASSFDLTSTGLNVNTTGDLTGVSSIDTISTSAAALTFAGAGTISASGANNLVLQGGSTNTVSLGTSTNLTAGGALTIDSNTTSALNFGTGANAKTITIGNATGATAVNINSGTGNINFTVDSTASSGKVQIGNSGTATPDLLVMDNGTADPSGVNGGMYYSTGTNTFRCYENGAWKNCVGLSSSLLTTKGDLLIYSTTPTRLPIGSDGNVLMADSTQANGMKWAAGLPAGTTNNSTLRYNSGTSTWQENTTFQASAGALTGVSSIDTINTSSTALTFAAGGTLSTTGANALAVNTGGAAALNLGTANTNAVAIGNAGSTFAVTSTGGLNVSTGGALTGVASIDTISTSATALTFAGAGSLSPGGANSLTLGSTNTTSATNIQSGTGNINLTPASTGSVTIGTSDTTGTNLVLDIKTDAGDPTGTIGAMYYNSNLSKFRCYEGVSWKDCDTSSLTTLQQAYTNSSDGIITTTTLKPITFTTPAASNSTGLIINQNSSSNPVALQINNTGTGNDITATNWSITKAGIISTSGNINATGTGAITSAGTLTASNGLTMSTGALSLTSTSGSINSTGLTGLTLTLSSGTGAITAPTLNLNTSGTGNTVIGNATGTFALTSSALNVTTGGVITGSTWNGTAIAAAYGGTGQTSYTTGDLLYASGTTALSKLADVAVGSYLRSGGVSTAPVWSTLTLPNSATTGDILYATASNTIGNLAAVATGSCLISQGVGVAPIWGSCGGSASALSGITAATTTNTISNGNNAQTWQWTLTSTNNGLNITETGTSSGTGYIASIGTASGTSTAKPLQLTARGNTIIDTTSTGGLTFGNTTLNTPITLQSGTGAINIGTDANAKTITVGNTTGATALNLTSGTGAITLTGKVKTAQSGSAITASESGAGTPTLATGSNDVAGMVTTSTTSHTFVRITFASTWTNAPFCVFSPANSAAGSIIGTNNTNVNITTTATTMDINMPSSTTASAWTWHCFGT